MNKGPSWVVELVIPVRDRSRTTALPMPIARRVSTLGVLDNSKAFAGDLLRTVAESMISAAQADRYVIARKASAGRPMAAEDVAALLPAADAVITGVSDCGACTASTVYDAVEIMRTGRRCVVVVTEVFEELARSVARSLGVGLEMVVVPHPLQGVQRDDVSRAAVEVVRLLST